MAEVTSQHKRPRFAASILACVRPRTNEAGEDGAAQGYSRVVHINEPERNKPYRYPFNRTSTTKYTLLTFLPKALFEQFRRLANLYFLFQAAISLTPLSPFTAVSIIVPLVFVIGVSMTKEAVEDFFRYQADLEVNSRKVLALNASGVFETKQWRHLGVGDIVKVERDQFFPADLLFLSSSHEEGTCYVDTMNLDGETNLKTRRALDRTRELGDNGEALRMVMGAELKCEEPNASLYTFVGTVTWQGVPTPLNPVQVLLRDSMLRNTEWVVGAVIFTGHDTKVFMNATDPPSKRSSVERQLDRIIIVLFIWLAIMSIITGIVFGIRTGQLTAKQWYLDPETDNKYANPNNPAAAGVLQGVTSLVLYGYLIPISLYVTIEIVKVFQARMISQDLHMYYEPTDTPVQARTSNLNEELGQIDTILSDKTGTLTQNLMEFFKCSIGGVSYGVGTTEVERAALKRLQSQGRWMKVASSGTLVDASATTDGARTLLVAPAAARQGDLADTADSHTVTESAESKLARQVQARQAWATEEGWGSGRGSENLTGVEMEALPGESGDAGVEMGDGEVQEVTVMNGTQEGSGAEDPGSDTADGEGDAGEGGTGGGGEGNDIERTSTHPHVQFFNFKDRRLLNGAWVQQKDPDTIRWFFRILGVCHTVIPEGDPATRDVTYQAESPDENALVTAAKMFGFFFYKRTSTQVLVKEPVVVGGEITGECDCAYVLLNVLEFNSTRKRMSVVVRDPEGRIVLMCKGADNVIYERLASDTEELREQTAAHLKRYANAGLRTLCLAYRILPEDEYTAWNEGFEAARLVVGPDRAKRIDQAAEEIERDLVLVGCTAVEDRLQEGVADTIDRLAKAGLKLWVLTGDKVETAINIGYACSLLRQGMHKVVIDLEHDNIKALEAAGDKARLFEESKASIAQQLQAGKQRVADAKAAGPSTFALVIDGRSLNFALDDSLKEDFLDLAVACASIICCRVSPKQKALVTLLVKKGLKRICLGIGDGANDVGMINAAHIGVGISGVEGAQAVMASDFAIAQFRYLERLLLVHGRWCYRRQTLMVCYFFYKNIVFGMTLFFFAIQSFWSGTTVYDDWFLTGYNLFFTSVPVIVVGVLDQDVSSQASINFPALYLQGQLNSYFNWSKIVAWMVNGVYASIMNYVLVITVGFGIDNVITPNGRALGIYDIGCILYTTILWTVTIQISVAITFWTVLHHIAIWGSLAIWYLFLAIYGYLNSSTTKVHKTFIEALAPSAYFWLIPLVITAIAVGPDYAYRVMQRIFKPLDYQIVQEKEYVGLKEGDPEWQSQGEIAVKPTEIGLSLAVEELIQKSEQNSSKRRKREGRMTRLARAMREGVSKTTGSLVSGMKTLRASVSVVSR